MKVTSIIAAITATLSTIMYFVIAVLRGKVNRLEREVESKNAEIKLVQENEQIKREVDDLSFDELSSSLRMAKTEDKDS